MGSCILVFEILGRVLTIQTVWPVTFSCPFPCLGQDFGAAFDTRNTGHGDSHSVVVIKVMC